MEEHDSESPDVTALSTLLDPGGIENVGKRKQLGVREVAQILGVDEGTVYRRARELGAKRGPNRKLLFEMERIRIVQETGLQRTKANGIPNAVTNATQREGERDAAVVAMLEEGARIADVVKATKTPLAMVMQIRKLWLESMRADLEGVVHPCQGCKSAPGNPVHSFCSTCGPNARVVREVKSA